MYNTCRCKTQFFRIHWQKCLQPRTAIYRINRRVIYKLLFVGKMIKAYCDFNNSNAFTILHPSSLKNIKDVNVQSSRSCNSVTALLRFKFANAKQAYAIITQLPAYRYESGAYRESDGWGGGTISHH